MRQHVKFKARLANLILLTGVLTASLSPVKADTPFIVPLPPGAPLIIPVTPSSPFVISSDGREVTDSRTNLIWQRCPVGMYWDNSNLTCSGSAAYYMWYEALHVAANTARGDGMVWRMPNIKELASILDRTMDNPAIDNEAFPATPNHQFWSATPYRTDAFFAWLVDFYDGAILYSYLEDMGAVRLVRDAK